MWSQPAAAPASLCVRLCSETMDALQCARWPAAWSGCVIPFCWKASGPRGLWFHSAVWLCHQWCWDLICSCVGAEFWRAVCRDKNRPQRKHEDWGGCFVFYRVLRPLHSPHSGGHERWLFMHEPILFQLPSSVNLVYVCAQALKGLWSVSPAGGSTTLS